MEGGYYIRRLQLSFSCKLM